MDERSIVREFEEEFRRTKSLAECAMSQVDEAALHARLNPQQNSIAAIVQHIAGNMVSRFTDFLTADGEKPDRDRESEFTDRNLSRDELTALWERGWRSLFDALAPLRDADLGRTVLIRREPHSVLKALVRQLAHYGWHVGQIVLLAKHQKGEGWRYLTIPPQGSAEFNRNMGM